MAKPNVWRVGLQADSSGSNPVLLIIWSRMANPEFNSTMVCSVVSSQLVVNFQLEFFTHTAVNKESFF